MHSGFEVVSALGAGCCALLAILFHIFLVAQNPVMNFEVHHFCEIVIVVIAALMLSQSPVSRSCCENQFFPVLLGRSATDMFEEVVFHLEANLALA